jgi:formiminotetrahydrofolate cyclodeaminase
VRINLNSIQDEDFKAAVQTRLDALHTELNNEPRRRSEPRP